MISPLYPPPYLVLSLLPPASFSRHGHALIWSSGCGGQETDGGLSLWMYSRCMSRHSHLGHSHVFDGDLSLVAGMVPSLVARFFVCLFVFWDVFCYSCKVEESLYLRDLLSHVAAQTRVPTQRGRVKKKKKNSDISIFQFWEKNFVKIVYIFFHLSGFCSSFATFLFDCTL